MPCSPGSSAGVPVTRSRPSIWLPLTCSSIPCAGDFARGRASVSISNMCLSACGPRRKRSTPTKRPTSGVASATRARGTEDLLELVRGRDLELIVPAISRSLVRTPAQEDGGVTEPIALQVIVLDLTDSLDPQRLPRQVLTSAPPTLAAWHTPPAALGSRPLSPRMLFERMLAQRRQLGCQFSPHGHRKGRCHADVVEAATIVVQPKQQRADELVLPTL